MNVKVNVPDVEALRLERSNKVKRYVRFTMACKAMAREASKYHGLCVEARAALTGGEYARANAILEERLNAQGGA